MIPIAEPALGEEELNNVIEAVKSGWISSQGKFILEFEQAFARYCGVKYGVATANGTVALHLALEALGIGQGDEVIVPTLTFVATANAVRYTGATPVLVDSRPDYWCIDPEGFERAITPRTKAIMPVHLYGHPCDMDAIMDIARRHGLYVIEDAAEAHGAEYKGQKVGSFGDINCFSFFGNKIITTGEGGMCLTNNDELASKMRILRDHGMNPSRKYWHDIVGFNYRMTNLQAAVGVAQVRKLDEFVNMKCRIAQWYAEGMSEMAANGMVRLHPQMTWAKCVYWMYSITIAGITRSDRDRLIEKLDQQGIQTRPLFHPIHTMPPYHSPEKFEVAEEISRTGLNLPSSHRLTPAEATTVVDCIAAELYRR
jgi:perosamine synthetase